MARIRTLHRRLSIELALSGRLTAIDVGRLEYACRRALVENPLSLQIDLSRVTQIDDTAGAFIERLIERGAIVRRPSRREA